MAGLAAAILLMAAALPILFWHLGTRSLYGDEALYALAARLSAGMQSSAAAAGITRHHSTDLCGFCAVNDQHLVKLLAPAV